MQNRRQPPTGEESLEGQARRIVRSIPILPIMFDGTNEEFSIDSQESVVSELSFSSDSPDSDYTVVEEAPIVELPVTPPRDAIEVRTRFQSVDQTLTPGTIGEALEKSGTVLMQRSRENRLAKQLVEMQTLIGANDELVVLKQPSTVHRMHSQPAFTPEVMRGFLEHSETMFHLVHDTQAESNVNEERTAPSDGGKPEAPEGVEGDGEGEFVGCFSKNDDLVMYKRTVKGAPLDKRERRESLDTLIAQHAQCLVEADNATQPTVQIYQSNDENVLAILTFSEQSAAVLKTPSSTVEGVNSYEDLNRVLLQTYRQLLTRPDEMISMQTHRPAGGSKASPHTHKPRSDVLSSRSDGSTSFGLTNGSRSGVCLEGSSKNWNKYPNARRAIEIVTNLRLMLEEFILRKIPASASVVKFLARLLTDVMHCSTVQVDEQFQRLTLIDQIKQVIDELLMPHELEDPLQMVNQARLTMEQILDYPVHVHTIGDFAEACDRISATAERLVCELDHDIEHPEAFIEALQYGLRNLLGSDDSRVDRKERQTSGTFSSVKEESHRPHLATVGEESTKAIQPLPTTVCHCFTSSICLFLGSSVRWLKEFLIDFWHFLITTPPILVGPSVSFRETVSEDNTIVQELHVQRNHLNQTMDVLQLVLEKSPSQLAKSTEQQDDNRPSSSVNVRSLKLFAQLLQQAGSIELSHSDSHHHLHLQLRESISGNLEKRQADGICMLAGDIRDHEESVAVCFDARMYDLDTLSENESAIECVTRVERLSCDKDEEDEGVAGRELVVNSVVEEIISSDHFESVKGSQTQSVEATQAENMRETMQELLEPVIATIRDVQERMENIAGDRLSQPRVSSSATITGLVERLHDSPQKRIKKEERYMNMDFPLAESLQELISMFHDANDRLAMIDCDVTAIRNQVQHLVSEQLQQLERLQQQPRQGKSVKPIQGDGHRSKRRRSTHKQANRQQKSRLSEGDEKELTTPILCCPIKQTFQLPPSNENCPVEIYSCHGVAPDVLVVHWNVDKDVIQHIAGYEIHVDGVLRSVCFSNKRRTALIANINLRQQHQLMLRATPVVRCKNSAKWDPAIFLYHL